jgi:transposase
MGELRKVYQGEGGVRELKEYVRGYNYLVKDTASVKSRMKAAFRSRGVKSRGTRIYGKRERTDWLGKIDREALKSRVTSLYEQLDCLRELRDKAEKAMINMASKHPAYKLLVKTPGIGPIRAAQILGIVGIAERFRTKRQFWPYCGLAVVTHESSQFEVVDGRKQRRNRPLQTRGLNKNFNRILKAVFKGAAMSAIKQEPFREYYQRLIDKKMRPEMALLTVARKIAAITLATLKSGEEFDPSRVNQVAGPGKE